MSCVFPSLFPQTEALSPAGGDSVRRGSCHAISARPEFQFGRETLCPDHACEINRTARTGYLGTILEQHGFVLIKTAK